MEGEGWGPKTPSENKTSVKVGMEKMMIMRVTVTIIIIIIIVVMLIIIMMQVYGSEKMDWRGECFLMAGVFGFALVATHFPCVATFVCLFGASIVTPATIIRMMKLS